MSDAALNLVVIRSADLDRAALFYGLLGVRLARERHGSGPEHLAGQVGPVVLEVYPSDEGGSTAGARLGFVVRSVSEAVEAVQTVGGVVITAPRVSPWGFRAVVTDPDGHRVELVEATADA